MMIMIMIVIISSITFHQCKQEYSPQQLREPFPCTVSGAIAGSTFALATPAASQYLCMARWSWFAAVCSLRDVEG